MAHSYRVAALARELAVQLKLTMAQTREIHMAALLHDLGKVGFDKSLFEQPLAFLEGEDRHQLQQHPDRGWRTISAVPELQSIAQLVKHHHERFDGQGFPDGLFRNLIPLGSRIIAVAEDYDELKTGWLTERPLTDQQALEQIEKKAGTRYDPTVVDVLREALSHLKTAPQYGESLRGPNTLRSGMVLSRDLISPEGLLLQQLGKAITDSLISHLANLQDKSGIALQAYVKQAAPSSHSHQ